MSRRSMIRALIVSCLLALAGCAALPEAPVAQPSARSLEQALAAPVRLRANGVELHYVEWGQGTPVVLIHGSLADFSYWQNSDQIRLLAAHYRVIAYSRRYNYPNQNDIATDHSPYVEAADLLSLLDRLGIARAHVVGHSYGAYSALAFAVQHPERLRTLVLAEPPIFAWLPAIPGGEGARERFMERRWEPLAKIFRDEGDAAALDFTARWYFKVPFAEVAAEWRTLMNRNVREWRALALSSQTYPMIDFERVRALRVPTLLLSGGRNAGKTGDLIDGQLVRLLPDVRRNVLPDASHEMFLDFPELTASAMLAFFGEH